MCKRIFLIAAFLMSFFASISVISHLSNRALDNDSSGELLLSKCLYDEKSLICPDWSYSTEFRINNQIIFALLFSIFENFIDVRITGIIIIEIILIGSFVFLLKSLDLCTESILFGMSIIILPYCVAYGRIVLYYGFYAPYLTFMFIIIGCFFQLRSAKNKKIWVILLFLFSFLGCINGIRQFFIVTIPLCFLQILMVIKKRTIKEFVYIIPCIFGSMAGLIVFYFVISKMIHMRQGASIKFVYKGISEFFIIVFSIMRQFGYRSNVQSNHFLWIMSLCGIFVMVYALFYAIKNLFTIIDNKYYVYGMLVFSLILNAFTFLFFDLPYNLSYDYARYLTPASVWCIPIFCLLYDEEKNIIPRIIFCAAMVIFIGNSLINICFLHNPDLFTQDFDGLPFRETADIGRYSDALAFIREEKYELGYSFNDANVLAEKLNGLPVIWIEEKDGNIAYLDWLSRSSLKEINAEKVFLCAYYDKASSFRAYEVSDYAEPVFNDRNRLFIYEINDPSAFKQYLDTRK